ncbi:2-phospho-L-lactate guanylyltransferase [Kineococcus sp. NUM-3379]
MSTTAAPPSPPRPGPWTLVLPVKGGGGAKSRLQPPPGVERAELALAIALDAVAAVAACPAAGRVLVVTADARVARSCAAVAPGVGVLREERAGRGLGAAVADGLAAAGSGPVAVLLPDLPALRPSDVAAALAAAGRALGDAQGAAFLPDADDVGTVLLAGRSAVALRPAFGPDSAAAHAALGAVRLTVPPDVAARLRRDVDTAEALALAVAAGVGPHTAAVLAAARATA